MPTVLITGANRGLGLEFVRQYAAEDWRVIAACRDTDQAPELKSVTGDVTVHALDVGQMDAIGSFAKTVNEPLDVVIANAGVYGSKKPSADIDGADMLNTLHINTVAPVALAAALLPLLRKGEAKKLIAISSQMGSIADNTSGGSLGYRASKAALNAAWHTLAADFKDDNIIAVTLHPGWVQTDMGGAQAPMKVDRSIKGMREVIASLTIDMSGGFYSFSGKVVPW